MANIYDDIINGTFSNPAMQTSGWGQPTGNAPRAGTVNTDYLRQGQSGVRFDPSVGFVPGAIPAMGDRLPQGTAGLPNPSPGSGLTPQQVQALGGWAVDPKTGQLAYSQPATSSASSAIERAMTDAGIPLPRARPGYAPSAMDIAAMQQQGSHPLNITVRGGNPPVGANPGMGGAVFGDGRMASSIPPQGAPPPGIAPTVFAGDPAPAQQQRPLYSPTGRMAYDAKNLMGQVNAQNKQANLTGTSTSGYTYQNGQRTGVADWAKGLTPSQQYAVANGIGQQKALQKQATLTGVDSMGRILQNGQVTGTTRAPGVSSAQYYDQKSAAARQQSADPTGFWDTPSATGGGGGSSMAGGKSSRTSLKSLK